jgi:hypothetical protein
MQTLMDLITSATIMQGRPFQRPRNFGTQQSAAPTCTCQSRKQPQAKQSIILVVSFVPDAAYGHSNWSAYPSVTPGFAQASRSGVVYPESIEEPDIASYDGPRQPQIIHSGPVRDARTFQPAARSQDHGTPSQMGTRASVVETPEDCASQQSAVSRFGTRCMVKARNTEATLRSGLSGFMSRQKTNASPDAQSTTP